MSGNVLPLRQNNTPSPRLDRSGRHLRCTGDGKRRRAARRNAQEERGVFKMSNDRGSSERGFAAMSEEERRKIAEKGGETVSKDKEHMSEIGRKGGEASAESREREDSGSGGRSR
jgi:uncharacterized protein